MSYSNFLRQIAGTSSIYIQRRITELEQQRGSNESVALSRDDLFWGKLYSGYMEIAASVESLKDTPVYLRRFPFRGTRVTRTRYVSFHFEAYLHEGYILRERLHAFARMLRKAYRFPQYDLSGLTNIEAQVDRRLTPIISIRGAHVHERRFRNEELERLSYIRLLIEEEMLPTELERRYFNVKSKRIGREWADKILHINSVVIQPLLDDYFSCVSGLVYSADGALIYPTSTPKSR
jgi:hypothetical protein